MRKFVVGCLIGIGIVLALGVAAFFVMGLMLETGFMPDTLVMRGEELREKSRARVEELIELREGETLLFYYGAGLTFEGDGSVVTDQRLASYETLDGEFLLADADYAEIDSFLEQDSEDLFGDVLYEVALLDGDSFWFLLSREEGSDRPAVEYVERALAEAAAQRAQTDLSEDD